MPLTFIRAPRIVEVHGDTEALAEVDGRIVAARQATSSASPSTPSSTKTPASTNCSCKCRQNLNERGFSDIQQMRVGNLPL